MSTSTVDRATGKTIVRHEDVVSAPDAQLWRRFRELMEDASVAGFRPAAIRRLSDENGMDLEELNAELERIRAELVAGKAIRTYHWFLTREISIDKPGAEGRWVTMRVHEGERCYPEFVVKGYERYDTQRYARNAAAAKNAVEEFNPNQLDEICDAIEDVVSSCNDHNDFLANLEPFGLSIEAVCEIRNDQPGFRVLFTAAAGRNSSFGRLSGSITPGQAYWIANRIRALLTGAE